MNIFFELYQKDQIEGAPFLATFGSKALLLNIEQGQMKKFFYYKNVVSKEQRKYIFGSEIISSNFLNVVNTNAVLFVKHKECYKSSL